jgi:hypothetical protein
MTGVGVLVEPFDIDLLSIAYEVTGRFNSEPLILNQRTIIFQDCAFQSFGKNSGWRRIMFLPYQYPLNFFWIRIVSDTDIDSLEYGYGSDIQRISDTDQIFNGYQIQIRYSTDIRYRSDIQRISDTDQIFNGYRIRIGYRTDTYI